MKCRRNVVCVRVHVCVGQLAAPYSPACLSWLQGRLGSARRLCCVTVACPLPRL